MSKTKLITDFICVATSGPTADGRHIEKQDLLDMAASYDPQNYTANIWFEHWRFANLGQVIELKTEEQGEQVKLYARIAPSLDLIAMNKRGQGLFTSIEIKPNFANSGKAYLYGLAVTDSPASLGTTQINFSARAEDSQLSLGSVEKFNFTAQEEQPQEVGALIKAFRWLFQQPSADHFSANNGNPKPNEDVLQMNKQELTAVITEAIAAAFSAQKPQAETASAATEKVEKTEFSAQPATQTAPQPDPAYVSVEQFNQVKAQLEELTQKFNQALVTEKTEVPNGANPIGKDGKFSITTAI